MIRSIFGGAVAAALLCGSPAEAAVARSTPLAWVISPSESGCRVDLELTARSGAVTPVSLISDGQVISLRFFKEDLPARAFLPIRIDKQRFSNLMLRGTDGSGELVLSEETEVAMRRGGTLGIAWLSEEPLTGSLAGSERGLNDLRVCGVQTAARHREQAAVETATRERAEAEARARELNAAQLAAVRAQTAAAEAQRRQVEDTVARQRHAEAVAAERAYAEARQRAYYEDERRRAYEDDRRRAYERRYEYEEERWLPPLPPVWPPRPRYPYVRF